VTHSAYVLFQDSRLTTDRRISGFTAYRFTAKEGTGGRQDHRRANDEADHDRPFALMLFFC